MSFWDSIGSLFKGGGKVAAARDTGRVYILDGERMLDYRGGEKPGPLDRFQLLQRMAQFGEREGLRLQIVFVGRPLREVANAGTYNGVQVYYAEQASNVIDQLDKLVRRAGRNTIVVTSDPQLETRIRDFGALTMKTSTLRKSLEGGGESRGEGDDGRNRQRRQRPPRGGRRPDQRQDQRQEQRQPAGESDPGESSQQPQQESSADTTVKNLIDLVE